MSYHNPFTQQPPIVPTLVLGGTAQAGGNKSNEVTGLGLPIKEGKGREQARSFASGEVHTFRELAFQGTAGLQGAQGAQGL